MTDETQLLDAAVELEVQTSQDEMDAQEANKEAEVKGDTVTEQPKHDPKDDEITTLKQAYKRLEDRYNGSKADRKLAASVVKGIMSDYGLDYSEAVKYAGANIAPQDLKARFESADVAENPVEVQVQAFNNLYVNAGVKSTLDEVYGEDTQPYVLAFDKARHMDEALQNDFINTDPAKLPAMVVKKGKEILERQKATESLADENTRLKAELEALKGGKTEQVMDKRTTLPLSGVNGGRTNGGIALTSALPNGMF